MNNFKKMAIAGFILTTMTACSPVPAGFVGVKVDLYGSDKGVQNEVVGTGKYWLGWNEELYLFPTFNQLHNYETPFRFQTSDSMEVKAQVGIEYYVEPTKVSKVFQTYRKGVEEITDINLRQKISDSLIKHSGTMDINKLASGGKTQLLEEVTKDLKKELDPSGIVVVKLSWVTDLDYPEQVRASINAKISATQKALLRENEVQQSKAEAQKKVEEAKGDAESLRLRAIAEAESIKIKSEALRQSPEVMQLEAINKWNGVLPTYMTAGTQTPFVTVK